MVVARVCSRRLYNAHAASMHPQPNANAASMHLLRGSVLMPRPPRTPTSSNPHPHTPPIHTSPTHTSHTHSNASPLIHHHLPTHLPACLSAVFVEWAKILHMVAPPSAFFSPFMVVAAIRYGFLMPLLARLPWVGPRFAAPAASIGVQGAAVAAAEQQ